MGAYDMTTYKQETMLWRYFCPFYYSTSRSVKKKMFLFRNMMLNTQNTIHALCNSNFNLILMKINLLPGIYMS